MTLFFYRSKRDHTTGERLLDNRRAERLSWCVPIICNSNDDEVKVWDYKESSGRVRTYLWLKNMDYVVVLERKEIKFEEVFFLITAYYVDGASRRRHLHKKYERRIL